MDNTGNQTVYLAVDANVTVANGVRWYAGERPEFAYSGGHHRFFHKGDWYGIVASGTCTVQGIEFEESKLLI